MRLLPKTANAQVSGAARRSSRAKAARVDLLHAAASASMRALRGNQLAMIFQEPMTSLNPVFTVGEQIAESVRLHKGLDRAAALRACAAHARAGRDPGRARSACTSTRTSSRAACASA